MHIFCSAEKPYKWLLSSSRIAYFDPVIDSKQIATMKTAALVATSYPPRHNN
jgi:hypothetical protein